MSGQVWQGLRDDLLKDAHGDVLEIGFGTGLNLPTTRQRFRNFGWWTLPASCRAGCEREWRKRPFLFTWSSSLRNHSRFPNDDSILSSVRGRSAPFPIL